MFFKNALIVININGMAQERDFTRTNLRILSGPTYFSGRALSYTFFRTNGEWPSTGSGSSGRARRGEVFPFVIRYQRINRMSVPFRTASSSRYRCESFSPIISRLSVKAVSGAMWSDDEHNQVTRANGLVDDSRREELSLRSRAGRLHWKRRPKAVSFALSTSWNSPFVRITISIRQTRRGREFVSLRAFAKVVRMNEEI